MKHGRALTIRLSAQQMERLETICQEAGHSKTTCVRRLIDNEWKRSMMALSEDMDKLEEKPSGA